MLSMFTRGYYPAATMPVVRQEQPMFLKQTFIAERDDGLKDWLLKLIVNKQQEGGLAASV